VRKVIKTRGHLPTDDVANKLIWLALRDIAADWGKAAHHWKEAMNRFAILHDERFDAAGRSPWLDPRPSPCPMAPRSRATRGSSVT
jgi:hypothetical protein